MSDNHTLRTAALIGDISLVRKLLNLGEDPAAENHAAIRFAGLWRNKDVIQVLIEYAECSNSYRYYYHKQTLYIHYATVPTDDTTLLPGTSIWCSHISRACWKYVNDTILTTRVKKSARSY